MTAPSLEDVLSVRLTDPDGHEYVCVSGTIPWTMGTTPNSLSLTILAPERIKEVLEFDGSFTLSGPGQFTRTSLPKPSAGAALKSVGWTVKVIPPGEEEYEISPLVLMEAVIELASVAEGSLGPFKPDIGDARLELVRLSFSDIRILWNEFGDIGGKRNFEDSNSLMRAIIVKEPEDIEIASPSVEVDGKGVISRGPTKTATFKTQVVAGGFAPESLEKTDLVNTRKLIEEIAERTPYLRFWEEGLFGPKPVASVLERIYITGIDYGPGMSPARALDLICEKAGLVAGITYDGRLIIDFDAVPSEEQFTKSNIFDKQARWANEERATRVRPRAPLFRFYPKNVFKEVVTTDFEYVAKMTDGKIEKFSEAAAKIGAAGQEEHLTYLSAVRAETERPGERDLLEDAVETGMTTTTQEQAERTENVRIVSDSVGRTYRYNPEKSIDIIRQVADEAKKKASEAFRERAKFQVDLTDGGKSIADATFTFHALDPIPMLDALLSTPLDVVTRVGAVDLEPRFSADVILHRAYDFLMHANVIATNSFDPPKIISTDPRITDAGFNQSKFDERVNQVEFFGRVKPGLDAPQAESHPRSVPGFSIPSSEGRTFRRTPADWSEAKADSKTLQSYFKRFLGFSNGKMRSEELQDIVKIITAPIVVKFGAPYTNQQTRTPPLEIFATWLSADATKFVKKFDPQKGVVEFSTTMGIFRGTISFRNFLRDLVVYLQDYALQVEKEALDPNSPYEGAGITIPPLPDTQMAYAVAKHINIILSDDLEETEKALAAIQKTTDFAKSAGDYFGADPTPAAFRKMITDFRERNSGKPLWQIASLKSAVEQETDPAAPPVGTVAPKAKPWNENIVGPSTGGLRASVTVALPLTENEKAGNATKTEAEDIGQTTDRNGNPGNVLPEVFPSPVLGQFYVKAKFNEYAWPHIEMGADGPARNVQLDVDWVEDIDGNTLASSKAEFEAAARKRFAELNSDSTIEQSEEIEIGGIFKTELGSVVRSATISWGDGGADPKTFISASSLISRRLPSLRAIQALSNGVVKGRK